MDNQSLSGSYQGAVGASAEALLVRTEGCMPRPGGGVALLCKGKMEENAGILDLEWLCLTLSLTAC